MGTERKLLAFQESQQSITCQQELLEHRCMPRTMQEACKEMLSIFFPIRDLRSQWGFNPAQITEWVNNSCMWLRRKKVSIEKEGSLEKACLGESWLGNKELGFTLATSIQEIIQMQNQMKWPQILACSKNPAFSLLREWSWWEEYVAASGISLMNWKAWGYYRCHQNSEEWSPLQGKRWGIEILSWRRLWIFTACQWIWDSLL